MQTLIMYFKFEDAKKAHFSFSWDFSLSFLDKRFNFCLYIQISSRGLISVAFPLQVSWTKEKASSNRKPLRQYPVMHEFDRGLSVEKALESMPNWKSSGAHGNTAELLKNTHSSLNRRTDSLSDVFFPRELHYEYTTGIIKEENNFNGENFFQVLLPLSKT